MSHGSERVLRAVENHLHRGAVHLVEDAASIAAASAKRVTASAPTITFSRKRTKVRCAEDSVLAPLTPVEQQPPVPARTPTTEPCVASPSSRAVGGMVPSRKATQMYLNCGQADYDYRTCGTCGLLYAAGLPSDEKLHRSHHAAVLQGIKAQGLPERPALVWQRRPGCKLGRDHRLVVMPHDPRDPHKKVVEVCNMVTRHLGLPKDWLLAVPSKVYLCIKGSSPGPEQIIGMAVAQRIHHAHRTHLPPLLPPPQQQQQRSLQCLLSAASRTALSHLPGGAGSEAAQSESCSTVPGREADDDAGTAQHAPGSGLKQGLLGSGVDAVDRPKLSPAPTPSSTYRQHVSLRAPDFQEPHRAPLAHMVACCATGPARPAASGTSTAEAHSLLPATAPTPQPAASAPQPGSSSAKRQKSSSLMSWLRTGQPPRVLKRNSSGAGRQAVAARHASDHLPAQSAARPDQPSASLNVSHPKAMAQGPGVLTGAAVAAAALTSLKPEQAGNDMHSQPVNLPFNGVNDDCCSRHGREPLSAPPPDAVPIPIDFACPAVPVTPLQPGSPAEQQSPTVPSPSQQPSASVACSPAVEPVAMASTVISPFNHREDSASGPLMEEPQCQLQLAHSSLPPISASSQLCGGGEERSHQQTPVLSSAADPALPRVERAHCGLRIIWVSREARRRGIAGRLLDAVRSDLVAGYVGPTQSLAFTQLTADGAALARSYTGQSHVLIYS